MARGAPGALIEDAQAAAARLLGFLESGEMPVVGGGGLRLAAQSVCIHGDGPGALAMARAVRARLEEAGVVIAPFLGG